MDYSDIDADRQPSRGRSLSRSPSTTPRADRRPLSRSRSPPPARYRDHTRSPTPRRDDRDHYSRRDLSRDRSRERPRYSRDRSPVPPPKPRGAPENVDPSNVVGVFGLSIRTVEADLEYEFGRIAPVEKVVIVYDARSGRSRGFGFITMKDSEGAGAAIKALNGIDLHGRRIRVDFSTTKKPHDPTPGVYKGEPRVDDRYDGHGGMGSSRYAPGPYRRGGDSYYAARDGDARGPPPSSYRGGDSYRGSSSRGYGPDASDDWRRRASPPRRDRRSVSPGRGGGRRREYTRSPSPRRSRDDRYSRDDREERVPPPARSRQASHLDSPPREEAEVEPSRFY
ncbi:hypothetical protein ACQY0O_006787 [Thecaphora frezii]